MRIDWKFVLAVTGLSLIQGCTMWWQSDIHEGHADAPPEIKSLPSVNVHASNLSSDMKMGWVLASQALEVQPPKPPQELSTSELQEFSDHTLPSWLSKKSTLLQAAKKHLNKAAEENLHQRIVAGAIVGLLYEDTWHTVQSIPVPNEFEKDKSIRKVYTEVLQYQTVPFVEFSKKAYMACALNSKDHETMGHWSKYCHARFKSLPGSSNKTVDKETNESKEVHSEVVAQR